MSDKKKRTEAQQELERMFGHEEEAGISAMDKLRLKLVAHQYRRSNVFYQVFFDKHYRPDRYDCIVNKQENFKNKNDFRTFVMQKYYRFPVKSTAFLQTNGNVNDFAQNQEEVPDESEQKNEEKDSIPRENVLMEKKLMRSYNRCLLGELSLYGVVLGTALYFGGSLITGTFNLKVANYMFILPGMTLSAGVFYGRTQHNKTFENQLSEIYKMQLDKYESFLRDKPFDEFGSEQE